MLIHPWDAATSEEEWRTWLAEREPFGVLAIPHRVPGEAPLVLPLHVVAVADGFVAHLARTNPAWPHLEQARHVRLAFHGDEAYIPGYWRAADAAVPDDGVPTSYYSAVQFVCAVVIRDDPATKARVLDQQLHALQPEGHHAPVVIDAPPYGTLLGAIRALELAIIEVEAKFKYDDHKPVQLRTRVAAELRRRGRGHDLGAASQQERRIVTIGAWRARTSGTNSRREGR